MRLKPAAHCGGTGKALFLILVLVSPALMPALDQAGVLGAPVLYGMSPAQGFGRRLAALALCEAAGVAWALAQRGAIGGGAFMVYCASLPLRAGHLRKMTLAILLGANTPLFVPVYAALYVVAAQPQAGIHALYVFDLVLLVLSIQMTMLERRYRELPWVLLFSLTTVDAIHLTPTLSVLVLSGSALALGFALLAEPGPERARPRRVWRVRWVRTARSSAGRRSSHRAVTGALLPLCGVDARILFERYRVATVARIAVLMLLTLGAILLMRVWDFDARALALALLVQAGVAMIASGAYRDLRREHERAAPYCTALPIPASLFAAADTLTVLLAHLPFALALAAAVALHRDFAGALAGMSSAILFAPLLAVLRVPHVHLPHQALVAGFLLSGAWLVLAGSALL